MRCQPSVPNLLVYAQALRERRALVMPVLACWPGTKKPGAGPGFFLSECCVPGEGTPAVAAGWRGRFQGNDGLCAQRQRERGTLSLRLLAWFTS